MKSFKQVMSEVAEPKSGDEKRFKDKHIIDKVDHPVALDHQFTGEVDGIGKAARIADHEKGEDEKVYEAKMDPVGQADADIDNDGDVDDSDEYLHNRRKAIAKAMKKEGNAFTKALYAAREAGDKTFMVAGKEYKCEDFDDDGNLKESYGTQAQRMSSPLQKIRQAKEKADRDSSGKLKSTAVRRGRSTMSRLSDIQNKANAMAAKPRKEEVEDLDEISMDKARATFQARQKLKNRAGLAGDTATAQKHQDKARKTQDIIRKRNMANEATMSTPAGRKQASAEADAHHKAMVKKWGASHPATKDAAAAAKAMRAKANEEVEQVDEISKDLVGRYIKKAQISTADAGRDTMDDRPHIRKRGINKIVNRRMGTADAIRKLTGKARVPATESFELDETYEQLVAEAYEFTESAWEEVPMMKRQLYFMAYAAEEIMEWLDSGVDPEEWFQNKMAAVHGNMRTLYAYVQGENQMMDAEADMFEETELEETTLSAVKRPVNQTGPDGKTRTVYRTIKKTDHDEHGQDIIKRNEEVELDEAFKAGILKLNDGSSVIVKKQDADLLNKMMKDLRPNNRKSMTKTAMIDKAGFEEILGFAREAL